MTDQMPNLRAKPDRLVETYSVQQRPGAIGNLDPVLQIEAASQDIVGGM
jgi:hypothetical protein